MKNLLSNWLPFSLLLSGACPDRERGQAKESKEARRLRKKGNGFSKCQFTNRVSHIKNQLNPGCPFLSCLPAGRVTFPDRAKESNTNTSHAVIYLDSVIQISHPACGGISKFVFKNKSSGSSVAFGSLGMTNKLLQLAQLSKKIRIKKN
jgi:hypothetical protein